MKIIIYVVSILILAGCANSLFYHPNKVQYSNPAQAKLDYESVYFKSSDGTKLHGWYIPAVGEEKGIIVHFHGNAQNITGHFPLVYWLPYEGYSLFMFDYRGYGFSEGKPEREGLQADSLAAIEYVFNRTDINKQNVFILGQSLGGANAIAATAQTKYRDIRAIIIESTFVSYQDIALEKAKAISSAGSSFASSPSVLASDEYSPKDYIKDLPHVPLLFIHGTSDRVIPIRHSRELYSMAAEPKKMWILNGGQHLQAFTKFLPQLKPQLLSFLESNRVH